MTFVLPLAFECRQIPELPANHNTTQDQTLNANLVCACLSLVL
jgi:hypothetical protein